MYDLYSIVHQSLNHLFTSSTLEHRAYWLGLTARPFADSEASDPGKAPLADSIAGLAQLGRQHWSGPQKQGSGVRPLFWGPCTREIP